MRSPVSPGSWVSTPPCCSRLLSQPECSFISAALGTPRSRLAPKAHSWTASTERPGWGSAWAAPASHCLHPTLLAPPACAPARLFREAQKRLVFSELWVAGAVSVENDQFGLICTISA